MQVARGVDDRASEGDARVVTQAEFHAFLNCVAQGQRAVQRARADRVFKKQRGGLAGQRPDFVARRVLSRHGGRRLGRGAQGGRVHRPVRLGAASQVRHRVHLKADRGAALLHRLYNGGSGATKRVEHGFARLYAEAGKVVADQMRRESEDEAIPVVDSAVPRREAIGSARAAGRQVGGQRARAAARGRKRGRFGAERGETVHARRYTGFEDRGG